MAADSAMKIIFRGEVLSGFDRAQVSAVCAQLMKKSVTELPDLFSGQPIVLKKGLTPQTAIWLQEELVKQGLQVHSELDLSSMSFDSSDTSNLSVFLGVSTDVPISPPLANHNEATGLLVTQSKRLKYQGRKKRLHPKRIHPFQFLSFSFTGRYGRLNELNALFSLSTVLFILVFVLFIAADKAMALLNLKNIFLRPEMNIFIHLFEISLLIMAIFYIIRYMALRLHDLDKSGWWSLFVFVPYVGVLFFVCLMMWPGSVGDNDYGRPNKKGSILGVLILFFIGLFGIYFALNSSFSLDIDITEHTFALPAIIKEIRLYLLNLIS